MNYKNDFEVMNALYNGKKVRDKEWKEGRYMYYSKINDLLMDNDGYSIRLEISGSLTKQNWEEYVEKEKLPKELEWIKSVPFENGKLNCNHITCDKCLFAYVQCGRLEKQMNQLKEKYEF